MSSPCRLGFGPIPEHAAPARHAPIAKNATALSPPQSACKLPPNTTNQPGPLMRSIWTNIGMIAATIFLVLVAGPNLVRAQVGEVRSITAEAATSDCIGDPHTPLCAVETFLACTVRRDLDLCATVGVQEVRRYHTGPGGMSAIHIRLVESKSINHDAALPFGEPSDHANQERATVVLAERRCLSEEEGCRDWNERNTTYFLTPEDGWQIEGWTTLEPAVGPPVHRISSLEADGVCRSRGATPMDALRALLACFVRTADDHVETTEFAIESISILQEKDIRDELRGAEWHWPGVADIVLHRRVCFGLLTCPHQEMWRYFYSVAPEGSEWNVVGWTFQGDEDFCRDAC